jgi:HK97 family phage major capsid protein
MEIKELVEQLQVANTELKSMKEKHETELKALADKSGAASDEAKTAITELAAKLDAQQVKAQQAMDDLVAQMKRPGAGGMASDVKTLGQHFVHEAKDLMGDGLLGKTIHVKDITGMAASAGALARPDRDPTVYRTIGGMRQIRIADLIPSIPTSSNAVEIMRLATAGNPAGPQQAASEPSSAVGGGELEAKLATTLTWELVTVKIPTIAVHTRASRQVLSDAPMLQSIIDSELTYKLQLESDAQLLLGDGTGQNLTGILNDASINDVGEIANGTSTADLPGAMIDHIRAGITECQLSEYYNVNGLVLNPADWQTLETAKATDGHYLLVAFAATSPETPSVWRVPVIVTNAMPADSFLLGDWNLGAQLYRREGVSVRVSESHADNFTQNAVQILAEERYGLGISRPKAFCKGSFEVASGS